MANEKFCKLICVTAENNNKWYTMEWDGNSSNFNVEYGRVESTKQTGSYPISQWQSKYNEKIRKGYKDVTHTVSVTVETTDPKAGDTPLAKIKDTKVDRFLSLMKQYTDGLVAKTYTVKAKDVTKAQVDEAQGYLDALTKIKKTDTVAINSKLLELYMVIPRYMSNVKDHLIPRIDIDKVLQQEQDNLDAMAAQVSMIKPADKKSKKVKEDKTLLDVLGITMKEIPGHKDLDYLVKQLSSSKIQGIFEIDKPEHSKTFEDWMPKQKNKETRVLLHGTRCTSVIPIIEQGLKIRPVGNYQFSGKVYGDGNYFSETCSKSLNYTGYDADQILLVFEVHTGKPFTYDGWYKGNSFALNYKELQSRGFDSTFVKAGGGLLNTEIIAYKEEQCRIKYIIWYKR